MTTPIKERLISTSFVGRHKFMSEEVKDVTPEVTTPENGAPDELNSILEALDDKGEPNKGEPKDYFKKVGNHVFKTEQDYDSWAQKNYGEVSRLSGELKRLETKLTEKSVTPEVKQQTEQDIDFLRMRIKAVDFFEDNPEALSYKEEMAAFLRSGKANDEKGRPSLELAYKKALKADGKDVVEKEDNKENIKKIMQAGSGDSGRLSEHSYQTDNDLKSVDDFANSALSGRI